MFSSNSPFFDYWCTDSRNVKLNLNFVKVQNLNWILWFEVYAHSNGHSMPQDAIVEQRVPKAIFYSLIVEGGFRFSFNTVLIHVLMFYLLNLDKCMPNLFCMVGYKEKFNRSFSLKLTFHDINYIYNCCHTIPSGHYIKVHRGRLRQISHLLYSNKNPKEEFLKVIGNWHTEEISCPASSNKAGL